MRSKPIPRHKPFYKRNLKLKGWSHKEFIPEGVLEAHLNDYCSGTTIHCVKYLKEKGRPLSERLCWIAVFIMSFCANAFLVSRTLNKWYQSPVIVTLSEKTTPVWEVTFPAVTICSQTKFLKLNYDYTPYLEGRPPPPSIAKEVADLSLICDTYIDVKGDNETNEGVVNFFKNIGDNVSDALHFVQWQGDDISNNSDIFSEIVTAEGICMSFNMLPIPQIYKTSRLNSVPQGLKNGEPYPRKARDSGTRDGLVLIVHTDPRQFGYNCQGFTPGFKIVLHDPAEIPNVSEKFFILPLEQEVMAIVEPQMFWTSSGLISYSSEIRQCYFPSENPLAYFASYTQRNCELECITNYTLKKCKCVGFQMPRNNRSIPICGGGRKKCMLEAKEAMRDDLTQNKGCMCLAPCNSVTYKAVVSSAKFDWQKTKTGKSSSHTDKTQAKITIYFSDKQFLTSRRREIYGAVDFIANCGGLISLFSGLSFLSVVEIIYYLTIRLWNNIKSWKPKKELIPGEIAYSN